MLYFNNYYNIYYMHNCTKKKLVVLNILWKNSTKFIIHLCKILIILNVILRIRNATYLRNNIYQQKNILQNYYRLISHISNIDY